MSRSYGVEWQKSHETTKYPFSSHVSLTNGTETILEGVFLDAHLYPIGGLSGLYLKSVTISHNQMVFTIADGVKDCCFGYVNLSAIGDNVTLVDQYGRPAGILISRQLSLTSFISWGLGTHSFEQSSTEFVSTCCMPTPEQGVRGIMLADGSLFTDNVWIVGDNGIVVRHSVAAPPDTATAKNQVWETIRIDIVGDPLFRRTLCNPVELFSPVNPVRKVIFQHAGTTISECEPDAFGNLNIQRSDLLREGSIVRVRATSEGLLFEAIGDSIAGVT